MSQRTGPADKNGEWVGHRVAVAVKPAKREKQSTMLSSGFWLSLSRFLAVHSPFIAVSGRSVLDV